MDIAEVEVAVHWRDYVWILTIESCPFCGAKHTHGGGAGAVPSYGHRAAHCVVNPPEKRSYTLIPVGIKVR